jgi:hypothetical protein
MIKLLTISYILKKVVKQTSEKAKLGELSINSIKAYLLGVQSLIEFNI